LYEGVKQFAQAHARFGRAANDGNQRALRNGLDNQSGKLISRGFFALEILHHQLFIDFDNRLDEGRVKFGGIDQGALGLAWALQRADDAIESLAVAQRHIEEDALVAERVANPFDERGKIDVVLVHLIDDDDPADTRFLRLFEDAAGVDFNPAVSVDYDHRGVN